MDLSEIEKKVLPHQADAEARRKLAIWRQKCVNFLKAMDDLLPEGDNKKSSVRKFETVVMWGAKTITEPLPLVKDERIQHFKDNITKQAG